MSRFSFRFAGVVALATALAVPLALVPVLPAAAAVDPVGLGVLGEYAVLGGTQVTNTGPSVIGGSVGVSPGSAITGFDGGPGIVVGGSIYGPPTSDAARAAAGTAYGDAAGRTGTVLSGVELGGQTLVSGVYTAGPTGTFGLTGSLTLTGGPDDVWIFQTESTLITAAMSSVVLTGGAQACNVFWKVGSSATLGATSAFTGTVLAAASITVGSSADVVGRLIAGTGEVTLINDTITRSDCATIGDDEGEDAAEAAEGAADDAAQAEADASQAADDAETAATTPVSTTDAAKAAAAIATEAAARAAAAAASAEDSADDAADAADDAAGTAYAIRATVAAELAAQSAANAATSAVSAAASRDAALTRAGLALAATGAVPASPLIAVVLLLAGVGALVGSRRVARR